MKKIIMLLFSVFILVGCDSKTIIECPTGQIEEDGLCIIEHTVPVLDRMTLAQQFIITGNENEFNASRKVTLEQAYDGDTAQFLIEGVGSIRVRFYGIDTPETHHPTLGEQPWGKTASDYMKNLLQYAVEIIIQFDKEFDKTDSYGRHLAWIWVDGELAQYKIIKEGLADIYGMSYSSLYGTQVRYIHSEAKALKKGIHGGEDPNWDYENGVHK